MKRITPLTKPLITLPSLGGDVGDGGVWVPVGVVVDVGVFVDVFGAGSGVFCVVVPVAAIGDEAAVDGATVFGTAVGETVGNDVTVLVGV
jgi:hypothetical protein